MESGGSLTEIKQKHWVTWRKEDRKKDRKMLKWAEEYPKTIGEIALK